MQMPLCTNPRDEMLDRVFNYFVDIGLENISMRKLCSELNIAPGSLYYWFENKETLLFEAVGYGLKKIVNEIFDYAFNGFDDLKMFFDNCLDKVGLYKDELRFIYQMAASPVYGDKMRHKETDVNGVYGIYAEKLADYLGKDIEKVKPLLFLFISMILDYIIWEDRVMTEIQLEYICRELLG